MGKLTKRQLDVIIIQSVLQSEWAKEDALQERCEQIVKQGKQDWQTECIRAVRGLKRVKPLIAYAKGLDSFHASEWISGDHISITIGTSWGSIEYELRTTKRLIALRSKIDKAETELHQMRYKGSQRRRRGQQSENKIRWHLRQPGDRADKARRIILKAIAELLKPESKR